MSGGDGLMLDELDEEYKGSVFTYHVLGWLCHHYMLPALRYTISNAFSAGQPSVAQSMDGSLYTIICRGLLSYPIRTTPT